MGSLETLTSRDGTPIAYERSGEGPPLDLVHGTTSDHSTWDLVLPELQKHFTVYTMDRRGRGDSTALEKDAAEALDAALPDIRIAVVPHQAHIAHRTAPGVFVRGVARFLVQAEHESAGGRARASTPWWPCRREEHRTVDRCAL